MIFNLVYMKKREHKNENLNFKNAKKRKKKVQSKEGLYEDTVSTYRIFSRAFCNFVFPRPDIKRPLPGDGKDDDLEAVILKSTADEDLLECNIRTTKNRKY